MARGRAKSGDQGRTGGPSDSTRPGAEWRAVTDYRNASKEQVQKMIRHILRLDDVPRPQHAADALAAAIAASHRNGFAREVPV